MSGIKAVYGLSGSGVPTGVNVSGTQRLGVSQTEVIPSDADIIYSVTITSGEASSIAFLQLATGSIDVDGTTTTVTRRSGGTADTSAFDFEGAPLPTMDTLYGFLIERSVTPVDVVSISFEDAGIGVFNFDETSTGVIERIFASGYSFGGLDAITIEFAAIADSVTLTIVGKSA